MFSCFTSLAIFTAKTDFSCRPTVVEGELEVDEF
jgi:hypothetical protein